MNDLSARTYIYPQCCYGAYSGVNESALYGYRNVCSRRSTGFTGYPSDTYIGRIAVCARMYEQTCLGAHDGTKI